MFDPTRFYKKPEIRAVTGQGERTLDAWVIREDITRYAFSKRDVRFKGADINAALERAATRGKTPAPPVGAAARARTVERAENAT